MMYTSQTYRDLEQTPVIIRALRSLGSEHADTVICAVAAVGNGWSVQTCDDYDGYLSIVVEPTDETIAQPTYLISGTANRIELAEMRDDELRTIGCFENVTRAVETLVWRCQVEGRG